MNTATEIPVNRQAANLFSKKRHTETVQQAVEKAAEDLLNGKLNRYLAEVFGSEAFGPEPMVTFKVSVRRDPAKPGAFSYMCSTQVQHDLGNPFKLYGLSSQG
jgi:hypothetical protein